MAMAFDHDKVMLVRNNLVTRNPAVWMIAVCLWVLTTAKLFSADSIDWDAKKNRVTADVSSWTLNTLLEQVVERTGWDVFIEPDTTMRVSAKFKDQPAGEALRRLLGNVNFALLPQTNAPAKLFIFRTALQEATQKLKVTRKGGKTSKPISDELIVKVKDGGDIEDIAKRVGAKVVGGFDGNYRLKFEDAEAALTAKNLLAGYNDVEGVDVNYYVERPPGSELLSASSSVPFTLNPISGADGSRTVIGLIDTPIQGKGSPISPLLLDSLSVFNGFWDAGAYEPSHATSMANSIGQGLSTLLNGTDTSVRILPLDVYGPNANATTFDVAHGIVLAIQNGATIINMSLGSEGNSQLLQTVIENGSKQGIAFIAAAGNEHVTTPFYPAAYDQVLAVTAGDRKGNIASYANYGDFVDVVGPGASVVQFNGNSFFVSGTSTSSAYVSGLMSALMSQKGMTVAQAMNQVRTVLTVTAAK